MEVTSCGQIHEKDLDASKFVDEIQVQAMSTKGKQRCCGAADAHSSTLRHLRILRSNKNEVNAIMGPLGFDDHGVVVDVGVLNRRAKVVVKDEYRWLESRNLTIVDSPDMDAKWFPEDLRVGDKVRRVNEATKDSILDNGRVGDVVAVNSGVLVKAQGDQRKNSRLWLVPVIADRLTGMLVARKAS